MRSKEYRDSFVAAHVSNTISAQINSMRHARGWTQGELADRSGMRQPRISALEDPDFENVEIATLQRLASAFDVALSVRFVPFSEIAQRSSNLNNSDFNIREYLKDLLVEQKTNISHTWNINVPMFGIIGKINAEGAGEVNIRTNSRSDEIGLVLPLASNEYVATFH